MFHETIALEAASTNDRLRIETAVVFEDWLSLLGECFGILDVSAEAHRQLALITLTALAGSVMLCPSLRSIEPITAVATAVERAARRAAGR